MKHIQSEDKKVTKYLHDNGAETSIKLALSGEYDENLNLQHKDNNKYSIVISGSVGCLMSCKFCHITTNNIKHKELTTGEIISNVMESIQKQAELTPEIKNKFIKLCWMGSGEPLTYSEKVKEATKEIVKQVLVQKLAVGLDGVDIATTYPKTNKWKKDFSELNKALNNIELNPKHNGSALRLFYSLHSASNATRENLIPNSRSPDKAMSAISEWCKTNNVDFIIHHMFINNVNDNISDIRSLKDLLSKNIGVATEFRILRYNAPDNGTKESIKLKEIVSDLKTFIPKMKIQHSSGSEIKSACGQFL